MSWSVAVFASRESVTTLTATVEAAASAAERSTIDVVVNGNRSLAAGVTAVPLRRVWFVEAADKANAWNEYVRAWQGSDVAFFVDGYVRVHHTAFRLLADALIKEHALAATGVPTHGRSAVKLRKQMLTIGGIHGNLFCIRGDVLRAMKERRIRLPLGIYRTDPLLGAAICYNLDPATYTWDSRRIAVVPGASWELDVRHTLAGLVRRRLRQAQGRLENLAVRQHMTIERRAPEQLPGTAAQLVGDWIRRYPAQARMAYLRDPLSYVAARRLLRRPPLGHAESTAMRLVHA